MRATCDALLLGLVDWPHLTLSMATLGLALLSTGITLGLCGFFLFKFRRTSPRAGAATGIEGHHGR